MDELLSQKEILFTNQTTEREISENRIAFFITNLSVPMDLTVELIPRSTGWTTVEIINANRMFQFQNNINPSQLGEGVPSTDNKMQILPGLSIVRSDGSVLDIYVGTLTVNADGSWTVTKTYDNYHPTGNEPSYSKIGNQILFQLPDIYQLDSYNVYPCSDFMNTVAYNSYAYIRTIMTVAELQEYFAENVVDLLLPLKQSVTYTITLDEVKKTMARIAKSGRSAELQVSVGSINNPVYGGKLTVYRDGTATLIETHTFVDGVLQELVTPVERHLESVGTLWSYFGINNVWADSGNILSITYRSQTPVNGMMWQRDRALQLRRRAIMAAAFQSLT